MLAEGAACPAQLGQMEMAGSLSPVLSNPQGLSVCQLRKGGKCRKLLCLGARGLGVLGLRPQTRPPLFWVWCTDPCLCVVLQEKEKKPLKEGVQDMLVKHHLFSWDIDG